MPRKPNKNKDHYNDPFPTRLRQLIDERELKQEELKGVLGVEARQSVTGYTDGSTVPTAEKIIKIAEYFRVSSDWLLGLTNIRHRSATMQDIERFTSLSPKSVERLALPGSYEKRKTFDSILSSDAFPILVQRLLEVGTSVENAERTFQYTGLSDDNRKKSLSYCMERLGFSVFRVSLAATELCNELYNVAEVEKKLMEGKEEAADGEHTED